MRNISRLLSILCFTFISALPVFADTIPAGFKGNLVEIKDQQIRVYQTGRGPDILLIHGLHKAAPGSKLIIYKKTGHMIQYAKPSELILVIETAAH